MTGVTGKKNIQMDGMKTRMKRMTHVPHCGKEGAQSKELSQWRFYCGWHPGGISVMNYPRPRWHARHKSSPGWHPSHYPEKISQSPDYGSSLEISWPWVGVSETKPVLILSNVLDSIFLLHTYVDGLPQFTREI